MNVDKTRRDNVSVNIDHTRSRLIDMRRHLHDRVPSNRHVATEPRTARPIQNATIFDEEVIGSLLPVQHHREHNAEQQKKRNTPSLHARILFTSIDEFLAKTELNLRDSPGPEKTLYGPRDFRIFQQFAGTTCALVVRWRMF